MKPEMRAKAENLLKHVVQILAFPEKVTVNVKKMLEDQFEVTKAFLNSNSDWVWSSDLPNSAGWWLVRTMSPINRWRSLICLDGNLIILHSGHIGIYGNHINSLSKQGLVFFGPLPEIQEPKS